MKNSFRSIKLILKTSPYDFFMMIFSLLVKFLGPIFYTYASMNLFKELPKVFSNEILDIKSILIFVLALILSNFHNTFYSRFYSTFVSMPRLERKLKENIHQKISRVSSENLINPMSDARAHRAIFAGTNLFRLVQTTMELLFTILSGISIIFIVATINIYISVGLIIALIPIILSQINETNIKIRNRDKKLEINRIKQLDHKSITESPQFIESRINNANNFFKNKYRNISQEYNEIIKKESKSIFKVATLLFPLTVYSDASGIAINIYLLAIKKITFAEFGGALAAYNSLKNQITSILSLLNYGRQFDAMVEPYFEFINMEERKGNLNKNFGIIEFKDVSFQYKNANKNALENINLTIRPEEKIAIVGLNGSGKTTFVRLLTGELIPTEGEVQYSGVSTLEIKENSMYDLISQVNQFFNRYAMSMKENISFDDELHFSEKDIKKFLKREDIDLADELSREFGGKEMSGGEWQRLAILRGFNKISKLITLDEPTSAIDPINEKEIYDFFYSHSVGKSQIIVTHRLGAIKYVDRIIVFKDGKIVEDGNFEELINYGGEFAKVYLSQSELFTI